MAQTARQVILAGPFSLARRDAPRGEAGVAPPPSGPAALADHG